MKLNRIAKRLDVRLDRIKHFHDLTETEAQEFDYLDSIYDEVEANMTISSTTERTIARKEKIYGIVPDESKTVADRVAVVLARDRGNGTTTPAFIRNVARSFKYGEISLDESTKPFTIIIKFESIYGVPSNLSDFKAAIADVMPCHLDLDWIYKFITWDEYEEHNKTLEEWDALNLTWDEFEAYGRKVVE